MPCFAPELFRGAEEEVGPHAQWEPPITKAPSSRKDPNPKLQTTSNARQRWSLVLGSSLELGSWMLELWPLLFFCEATCRAEIHTLFLREALRVLQVEGNRT